MQINFQRLKYFIVVAEELNFTKAAQKTYISKQALNKQIMTLEEEIGCQLFVRSTKSVELTEDGQLLYDTFAPIVKQYDDGCLTFAKKQHKKKNTVKIGYFQAISREDVIRPLVHYLQKLKPEIQIQIHAGEMNEVMDWMQSQSMDLCITNTHEYETWCEDYEKLVLFQTPAVIVTSLHHPWKDKKEITKEDMEQTPILLMRQRKEMQKGSFYYNIHGSENVYTPNFSSLIMNLETGPFYAVFPKLFDGMKQENLIYHKLPEELAFQFRMLMLYRKDNRFAELFSSVRLGEGELELHI